MVSSRLLPLLQFCIVLYVSVAIVYTTSYFVVSPLNTCLYNLLNPKDLDANAGSTSDQHWFSLFRTPSPGSEVQPASTSWLPELSKEVMYWNTSDFALQHGLGSLDSPRNVMSEELFLSKAFSHSMRPSKTIPFFYRASGNFDREDITITTLVTSDRFKVFGQLVERYQGLS